MYSKNVPEKRKEEISAGLGGGGADQIGSKQEKEMMETWGTEMVTAAEGGILG